MLQNLGVICELLAHQKEENNQETPWLPRWSPDLQPPDEQRNFGSD
jgi:hypothetical protein